MSTTEQQLQQQQLLPVDQTTVEHQQLQQQQQQQQQQQLPSPDQQQSQSQPQPPQQQQQQQPQQQIDVTQQLPEVIPANAVEGGREVSNKILYVGGLNKSVTEDILRELFSVGGPVQSIKILYDKNQQALNYAFIEYDNTQSAEIALQTLNGRVIDNIPIRINWAYQSQQLKSNDSFNVFVGDLSPEVNDELLGQTFGRFPSLIQAHVMWDMQTGRSRGYGFLSFSDQIEADNAIQTMNGEWIAGRAIRLNWATHKQQQQPSYNNHHNNFRNGGGLQQQMSNNIGGGVANGGSFPMLSPQNFDMVLRQTPSFNTTVYMGNLSHYTTQNDIIPLLQQFGYIVDFKFHPERGCAFVKFDSHERAAMAIVNLNGLIISGRQIKSNWGKGDMRNNYKHAPVPVPTMYTQGFN